MKTGKKLLSALLMVILLSAMLLICAAAEDTGYTFDSDGVTRTNIKWTVTTEGSDKVCTFEIDPSATGNKASTIIYGIDPVTGVEGAYATPIQAGWGQVSGVKKIVIKEGITEINGGMFTMNRNIVTVELPTSLVTISNGPVFEGCKVLSSVYVAGTDAVAGTFDLSCVTSFPSNAYMFDGCSLVKVFKMNQGLTGELDTEFIKNMPLLTELEIPAGVTTIKNKALSNTTGLKTLIILGNDTVIASDSVFNGNTVYPAIKAKAGSKAAEFAKANGYTFIDLDTGEETAGTKPAPSATPQQSGGTSSGGTTTPADPTPGIGLEAFNPEEATAYGYVGGEYYDTYWVYYQDTKTLKFFSNKSSGWNETGRIDKTEDKVGWEPYKKEIEYVEIGPYIHKVTGSAFKDHTALKEVKLGRNISQIDGDAFAGCAALTTVWYDGGERVEGRCDLSKVTKVNSIITGTAINEVLLSKSTISILGTLGFKLKTILAPTITDDLIQYAKDNSYNLQSTADPNVKYEYWIEIPDGVTMCGDRCGYIFDEATGTLTVYGSGAIADIVNYYGGGSKNSPWFSVKKQIKHVVLTENITAIGKYNFTQCENLETVQLPNSESFTIENAAFEKCSNLKSIYLAGNEPIEGTLDLRNVHELKAWTFAYDYLIANVIISPLLTEEIDDSAFEENTNLAGVYGTPGTYAETFASDFGLIFSDISVSSPEPITCTPPETTLEAPETTEAPESTDLSPESDSAEVTTENPLFVFEGEDEASDTAAVGNDVSTDDGGDGNMIPVIIAVAAVLLIAAAAVIIILKKKKS